MKKKKKHKKQQGATHPVSESERFEEMLERAANNPRSIGIINFDTTPRKLRRPSHIGETSDIRIDKKNSSIWW